MINFPTTYQIFSNFQADGLFHFLLTQGMAVVFHNYLISKHLG